MATSGGPDSQVLLDLVGRLRERLGWRAVWAAGIDHGLRPAAAAELDLAEALAGEHGIPFSRTRVRLESGNVMAQARRARYRALRGLARRLGADYIAVAHTATDQLETLLWQLVRRGAAPSALGMPVRRGRVVRPLLGLGRDELLAYAQSRGLHYAQDPTNTDLRRTRARLRHVVLPTLRELNPRLEQAAARLSATSRHEAAYITEHAERWLDRHRDQTGALPVGPLASVHPALRGHVFRLWLTARGVVPTARLIGQLERGLRIGRLGVRQAGVELTIDRGRLWAIRREPYNARLPCPGELHVPGFDLTLRSRLDELPQARYGSPLGLPPASRAVALDADRLHCELLVRGWEAGDRLRPFGLCGSVKVGDLFTNAKIPRPLRPRWPVVLHGEEIVWVVGLRRGDAAPITSQTRRIVTVEVAGVPPWGTCYSVVLDDALPVEG